MLNRSRIAREYFQLTGIKGFWQLAYLCFSIFLILFTPWANLSYADSQENVIIFAEPCLNIREKPDSNSNSVRCAPFLSNAKIMVPSEIPDSDNIIEAGKWYLINYGNEKGYVLGKYLVDARYFSIPEAGAYNNDFRILLEGEQCGSVNYSPDLNWYGLYLTSDKSRQELRKVNVTIKTPNTFLKDKKTDHDVNDTGSKYFFVAKTSIDKESMFLIGTKSNLSEGAIDGFTDYSATNFFRIFGDFLYPEQPKKLDVKGVTPLYIKAKIEAYIDSHKKQTIKKRYEIEIAEEEFSPFSKINSQNLSPDIQEVQTISCCEKKDVYNRALLHIMYRNPVLLWYGDIDRDGKMDLLFFSHNMADGGGVVFYLTLFLSSKAEGTDFVKKVAELKFGCDS